MNTRTHLIALPLLLLAMGALAGCIRNVEGDYLAPVSEQNMTSDTHLPTDSHTLSDNHMTVDPRLLERFEESEWVRVSIGITFAPEYQIVTGPHDDAYEEFVRTLDWELFDQDRADRWADVVSALGIDFQQRFPGTWITASGLEKLRNHPFVFGVGPYGIDPIEPMND